MSSLYLSSSLDVLVNILVAIVFISVIAVVLYGGGGREGERVMGKDGLVEGDGRAGRGWNRGVS